MINYLLREFMLFHFYDFITMVFFNIIIEHKDLESPGYWSDSNLNYNISISVHKQKQFKIKLNLRMDHILVYRYLFEINR